MSVEFPHKPITVREKLLRIDQATDECEEMGCGEDVRRVFPKPAIHSAAECRRRLEEKLEFMRTARSLREVWE